MNDVPQLPIGRYRARFAGAEAGRLPRFAANAWRGALGHALKRTVCVTREPLCRACMLYQSCLFPYFWDTPPPPGAAKMRKYQELPHPFVLYISPDEPEYLEFSLLGQANRHLPVFVHALGTAATGPKGIAGARLALEEVQQGDVDAPDGSWRTIFRPGDELSAVAAQVPAIPAQPQGCTLTLLSPLRVKREGRHVGPEGFQFADLFGNLLRRISMLTYFHAAAPLEADFRGLMAKARQMSASCDLRWEEFRRYSARQKAVMRIGGVVGTMHLAGDGLAPFWPYLWLGQFTHAGAMATLGFGRYRIVTR
jgi:hypothetical protein